MCSLFLLCVLVPIKFNSRDGYALDLPPLFRTSSSTVTEHHNVRGFTHEFDVTSAILLVHRIAFLRSHKGHQILCSRAIPTKS